MDYNEKNVFGGLAFMVKRNVKFQYFGLVRQKKENNRWKGRGKVDIDVWMDKLDRGHLLNSVIDLGDAKASVDKVEWFDEEKVWVFRFMKLREDNIPSIVKENQEAVAIPLGDDEYIGEGLHLLYDNESGIAMVQINRFSLGLKKLERFLTYIWREENERIRLIPILDDIVFDSGRRRKFRCIEIKFANISSRQEDGGRSLGSIMNLYNKFHGVSGYIKIGLGNTKRDTLNIDEVEEIVEDSLGDDSVDGLKLHVKDDDAKPVEIIDLFDKVSKDILTFNMEDKTTLKYSYAARKMRECYVARKDYLLDLITS